MTMRIPGSPRWRAACTGNMFRTTAELTRLLLVPRTTREPLPRRTYRNPPVVEALVDIQVTAPDWPAAATGLKTLLASDQYPDTQEIHAGSVAFDVTSGANVGTTTELEGYRFISGDKRTVVQARRHGLAVSALEPYPGWEALRDETARLWARYRALVGPSLITRLGIRYVNRLVLPFKGVQLREFLQVFPAIGEVLPNRIGNFLLRVEILPPNDPNVRLIVTEGRELNPANDRVSIVLDLDVGKPVEIDPTDESALANELERLHVIGNDAFEGCITDKARELFG